MRLRTELLPHQVPPVEKLAPIRVGALFMDMGTGKTRTAIELVARRRDRIDRVVWFCPVSLKHTVAGEIRKHSEGESVYVFDAKTRPNRIPEAFWHVVGIESMSASRRIILSCNSLVTDRSLVIVDESSYIKGHYSARTNWITRIAERARYRLILTGTPLSQGVVDLYAQMRFLSPAILGYRSFYSFAANHLEYSDKFPGMIVRAHNTEWLAAKIKPYVYQVTKDECLDLPDKLYETRYCSLGYEQLEAYAQVKEEILSEILESERSDLMTICRLFTALQEIACGFWNRRHKVRGESGRVLERIDEHLEFEHDRLDTLLDVLSRIPDGEKVIIWTKFQHDISQIQAALGDQVALFHGGLSERERNAEVDKFRREKRYFLATPSAGGHGLTLNEAAYVVFYNNGFKYSERLQAEDRCHRIGQTRPVTYIDIVCAGTIDERIQTALAKKQGVAESFRHEVQKVRGDKGRIAELVRAL